ncbi:MAG: DUF3102 domain-containing protein [Aristaeellaceae bacterium]
MSGTVIRTAETIAAEINVIKAQVRQTAVMATIEIGKRLKEAKSLVPYGEWGRWLEEHVDYSERKAQNAMALAEEYEMKDPQAIADLDVTKAVMLLAVPGEEREAFVAEHQVEDISVRELKAAIEQLKAEKEKQQLTIDELMARAAEPVAPEPDRALEAEVDRLKAKLQESEDRAESMRVERAKADAKAAELQAAQVSWKHERERLEREKEGRDETIARLREEARQAAEPVVTTVDNPETLAELERLRAEKESAASIANFRAAFDVMKKGFGDMAAAIEQMDEVNRLKYSKAALAALRQLESRFGGA